MNRDLTKGPVIHSMLLFAVPMILGDLLQQCYNIADTLIVGQFLGRDALAAVGSSFTLMTFLTSIILGLCMGSGALFSMRFGQRDETALRENLCASFFFIAFVMVLLNILAFVCLDGLRTFLRVPAEVWSDMRKYLFVIFMGIPAVFLYNYFASFLRAIGNSVISLAFLAVSAVLNIALDLWFVIGLNRGVTGAAEATVIAQYLSGVGIALYALMRFPQVRSIGRLRCLRRDRVREIISFSTLTCVQQSVMNLGILMVQGLVNSFGPVVMAAFAAAPEMNWSPVATRPRCTRCAPIALPAVRASSADSTASGANTVGALGSPMHTQPRTKPMGAASKSCCTSPSATTMSPTARPLASPPAMPVLMTAPGANRSMSTCVQRAALTLPMPHRTSTTSRAPRRPV